MYPLAFDFQLETLGLRRVLRYPLNFSSRDLGFEESLLQANEVEEQEVQSVWKGSIE